MSERPQVLLVGAGAVGQAYGYHLSCAGADVAFFVKEKNAAAARKGFRLYRIPGFRVTGKSELRDPIRFECFRVVTRLEEVAGTRWDQVYLCMSSTALRSGWFPEFSRALAPETTLVLLQPGLEDRDYVTSYFPAERLVLGVITLSSYSSPLPGENASSGPGTAYWLPPTAPASFSEAPGAAGRAEAVVSLLRRGDFPSRTVADVRVLGAFGASILMMVVAALRVSGWSFGGMARDRALLRLACAAAAQALSVSERSINARAGLARWLARPFVLGWVLRLAPAFAPFPIETFFQAHFTKVADQTVFALETYSRLARELGLPADAIESLLGRLRAGEKPAPALSP